MLSAISWTTWCLTAGLRSAKDSLFPPFGVVQAEHRAEKYGDRASNLVKLQPTVPKREWPNWMGE